MHVRLASRYDQGRWTDLILDIGKGRVYLTMRDNPYGIGLTMADTRWYNKIKEDPAFQMLALVFYLMLPW